MALIGVAAQPTAAADELGCGARVNGDVRCSGSSEPIGTHAPGTLAPSVERIEAVPCGPRVRTPTDLHIHEDGCFEASVRCLLRADAKPMANTQVVEYFVYSIESGELLRIEIVCDVALGSAVPAIGAIKAEATKRAPHLYAATGGVHFPVSAAIVFWLSPQAPRPEDEEEYAQASTTATIPDFVLNGRRLSVQLHVVRSEWDWDDRSRVPDGFPRQESVFDHGSPTGPMGQIYDETRRPCESNQMCGKYLAHAWYRTGKAQVKVRTRWAGSFSVDGGVATPIPGDIYTDSPAPKVLELKEYRTVLLDPNIDPDRRPGD